MSPQSTTLSVRLPQDLKTKLSALSKDTQRSNSFLAAKAIADYVERESEIIDGIKRGIADMKAGRTTSHEEAMERLYKTARSE
jgi:predicted transcriptional regulator